MEHVLDRHRSVRDLARARCSSTCARFAGRRRRARGRARASAWARCCCRSACNLYRRTHWRRSLGYGAWLAIDARPRYRRGRRRARRLARRARPSRTEYHAGIVLRRARRVSAPSRPRAASAGSCSAHVTAARPCSPGTSRPPSALPWRTPSTYFARDDRRHDPRRLLASRSSVRCSRCSSGVGDWRVGAPRRARRAGGGRSGWLKIRNAEPPDATRVVALAVDDSVRRALRGLVGASPSSKTPALGISFRCSRSSRSRSRSLWEKLWRPAIVAAAWGALVSVPAGVHVHTRELGPEPVSRRCCSGVDGETSPPTLWSMAFGRLGLVRYTASVVLAIGGAFVRGRCCAGDPAPNRCSHRPRGPGTLGAMSDTIVVRGAREHNLRNVDLVLPRDQLIVFTGLSGSGKSSLAFDTIYAEGQRRYVESLSAYARQFLGQMDKPDVDFIEGLSPAISIDQKSASRNPRSTVGTITEIYDYLRLLYARIGVPHCPNCGRLITRQTPAADRRPRAPAARRHPLPGARAGRARPQGRVPRRCSTSSRARASRRARVDGEVVDLPGQARARALREAHDRGRRRPAGAAARASSAGSPTRSRPRCGSPRASPRSRSSRKDDEEDEAETLDVLRAPRVHALRPVVRRAGAAQLLVQLALRRVRDVRRPRHAVRGRPRADRPRRRPVDRRGRDRAVVGLPRRVLQAGARRGRRRVRLLDRHAVEEARRPRRRRSCCTASGNKQVTVRYKNRYGRQRSYTTQFEGVVPWLERRHTESESRPRARADRGLHARWCRARRAAARGCGRRRSR